MKILQTLLLSLTLITAALHFQSCGPDCDAECPEIKAAPQEFLDYWFFPEGSWWVYQLVDEDTAIFDTIYTEGGDQWAHEETPECNGGFAPCRTNYQISFIHSNDLYFPNATQDGFETYRCEYSPGDNSWYLFHITGTNKLHSFSTFLKSPLQLNEAYYEDTYLCTVDGSLTFDGKNHTSLSVCNEEHAPPLNGLFLKKMSFAQGIGLYYMQYNNDETWELIDYHINQ